MPGPTKVAVRFSASSATSWMASLENVPSLPAGSASTGISIMRAWMMGATGSGTASVT